jgi:hypothetical protein
MLVAGCGEINYSRVTDVSSGKAYYTTKVATVGRTVQIQDERTESMMTLHFVTAGGTDMGRSEAP